MNNKTISKRQGRNRIKAKTEKGNALSFPMVVILSSFFLVLSFSLVSALPNDADNRIDFTYSSQPVNYSLVGVNDSYYHQGLTPQQVANLYVETGAGVGSCPDGQVVQNTTTGGVQCVTPSGGTTTSPIQNNGVVYINESGSQVTDGYTLSYLNKQMSINTNVSKTAFSTFLYNDGANTINSMSVGHARGNNATNVSTTQPFDALGEYQFKGWTNAEKVGASIRAYAGGGWSSSANDCPSYYSFMTASDGTCTQAERMRLDETSVSYYTRLTDSYANIYPYMLDNTFNGQTWYYGRNRDSRGSVGFIMYNSDLSSYFAGASYGANYSYSSFRNSAFFGTSKNFLIGTNGDVANGGGNNLTFLTGGYADSQRRGIMTNEGKFGWGTLNPQYPLDVRTNVSGITAWFEANISVGGIIVRSIVNNDTNVFNDIRLGSELLNSDGSINHSALSKCYISYSNTRQIDTIKKEVQIEQCSPVEKIKLIEVDGEIIQERVTEGDCKNVTVIEETPIYKEYIEEGWDFECISAMNSQALAVSKQASVPIQLQDNSFALDGKTAIFDTILTKSKIVIENVDYTSKFKNKSDYTIKIKNPSYQPIFLKDGTQIGTLDMENRIVNLEGYATDEMACLQKYTKFEDYRNCMLGVLPKK